MKINLEVDCTPEEARRLMGLPDLSIANQVYSEAVAKMMKGAGSLEQMQDYAMKLAPMGQMGLKLFQQVLESGAAFATGGSKKNG